MKKALSSKFREELVSMAPTQPQPVSPLDRLLTGKDTPSRPHLQDLLKKGESCALSVIFHATILLFR